ncbi:MAG: hypothetical protein IPO27_09190 [Bacteroidetes bacterium]|nr:hypothetical protein [Bacteroidota bacterium]
MVPYQKSIVGCFTSIFVLMQVLSNAHAWSHHDDFHCLAKNEYHFHQHEHSCTLCDYAVQVIDSAKFEEISIQSPFAFNRHTICALPEGFRQHLNYTFPERGPPLV